MSSPEDEFLIFFAPSMTTTRLITIAATMPIFPKFLALIAYYLSLLASSYQAAALLSDPAY